MTDSARQRAYDFGPFRLDAGSHRLLRQENPIALKPKAFDLLLLLVENPGRVASKEEILRTLWPDTIVEEASLSQNVYEIRKALGDTERPYRYLETVPRRGYRFIAAVSPAGGASVARPSIAVLPFVTLGSPVGSEHLELGIADAIITALTRIRGLSVRPTSAIARYAGRSRNVREAARELGASFVVDGSIQLAGGAVRAGVQLLDVGSESAVWGATFDGTMEGIFAFQDSVAENVAAAVGLETGTREGALLKKHATESAEAYQLYMKGRYNWTKATPEALWKAVQFFRAALDADPGYALAWVGLADAYTSLDWYGVLSTREANPRALEAAARALEIDDTLAEAHASLAMARQYGWEWEGAESAYRTAIALNPDYAPARQWFGVFLAFLGRFEEALTEVRRAEALDPASLSIVSQVGLVLLCARQLAEADAQIARALEIDGASLEARFYLAMIRELQGNFEEAIRIYGELPPQNPDFRAMLAHAYGMSGERERARAVIADLLAPGEQRYVPPFWLAIAHLGLDEREEALSCLEQAVDDPDDSILAIGVFAMLDPLRNEPRFARVLARMGLANRGGGTS